MAEVALEGQEVVRREVEEAVDSAVEEAQEVSAVADEEEVASAAEGVVHHEGARGDHLLVCLCERHRESVLSKVKEEETVAERWQSCHSDRACRHCTL